MAPKSKVKRRKTKKVPIAKEESEESQDISEVKVSDDELPKKKKTLKVKKETVQKDPEEQLEDAEEVD